MSIENILEYVLEEIAKQPEEPHNMANEELADKIFPDIKEKYPEVRMVKIGTSQRITVTDAGRAALIESLKTNIEQHENKIREINSAIEQLK